MNNSALSLRHQFPIFQAHPRLVYLDSAATAQQPEAVLHAMQTFEETSRANVHRGMHGLAEKATVAYEQARVTTQKFLNATHASEIIFTKNATESLNLVAHSWGASNLQEGDAIVLSVFEHHSNTVPWLQVAKQTGAKVLWIECDEAGDLRMDQYKQYLAEHRVKVVAITGQSNVTGYQPHIARITKMAHEVGAVVCIDAAQLVVHHSVDVQTLQCDFLAFSGHKLYGPTGIGVLYAKREHLETMPPFLGGGSMIHNVSLDEFTPAEPPQKFEAGTPPITQAVGLAAAIEWINDLDWNAVKKQEEELYLYALEQLHLIKHLEFVGMPKSHCHPEPVEGPSPKSQVLSPKSGSCSGCLSFTINGIHPHDLTDLLGQRNICLRAGHHCTQPLHDALGITASTRLSIGLYNTKDDIDRCCEAIQEIQKAWSK